MNTCQFIEVKVAPNICNNRARKGRGTAVLVADEGTYRQEKVVGYAGRFRSIHSVRLTGHIAHGQWKKPQKQKMTSYQ